MVTLKMNHTEILKLRRTVKNIFLKKYDYMGTRADLKWKKEEVWTLKG